MKYICLLRESRKHLILVNQQLQHTPYPKLIAQPYKTSSASISMNAIVKSYFWSARFIKNCDCLPRSIALFQHLTAAGFEVEHKFGVNKQGAKFVAHAWVEYQHQPLNEPASLKDDFKVLKKS